MTRSHDDPDLAIWLDDLARISELLEADDWTHAPDAQEDGGTGYEREGVRLELTFLVRAQDETIFTPLREGSASWPDDALGGDVLELSGTRSRLVALAALARDKASPRSDPHDAAKDQADFAVLAGLKAG